MKHFTQKIRKRAKETYAGKGSSSEPAPEPNPMTHKSPTLPQAAIPCQPHNTIPTVGVLLDHLCISIIKSDFEKTPVDFLPQDAFETILTAPSRLQMNSSNETDIVLQLMLVESKRTSENDRALANYILERARKVFLVTICSKLEPERLYAAMKRFKSCDFDDDCLPLEEWSPENLKNDSDNHPLALMKGCQGEGMERIWDVRHISGFQREQWKFLAPIISTAKRNHEFGQHILPFIERGTAPSSGAHGIVYRYAIHPAHFKDDQSDNNDPEDQQRPVGVQYSQTSHNILMGYFRTMPHITWLLSKNTSNVVITLKLTGVGKSMHWRR